MAVPVIMPRQGQSVESCIIAKWHKKKGDRVEIGDILFSYETDKASFDEEAKVAGVLLDIFFEEGDDVPCLTNVCAIGNEGESAAEFNPKGGGNGPDTGVAQGTAGVRSDGDGGAAGTGADGCGVAAPQANQHESTQKQNNSQLERQAIPAGDSSVKISPRARNLAEKAGVDYRFAAPSGPYGRIIERDIQALRGTGPVFTPAALAERAAGSAGAAAAGTGLGGRVTTTDIAAGNQATAGAAAGADAVNATGAGAAQAAVAGAANAAPSKAAFPGEPAIRKAGTADALEYEEIKLPNIRKVIAKAMHQSISSMAQLTLNSSFDAGDILAFRKKLKENGERLGLNNITINDIIIYAVSRTLMNHRDLNAHFLDDRMLYFRNVNIGVAVDTDRGLMVPTIFNANLMSLDEISAEVKRLAKDCQSGTINPDLLRNGTFTVTNLGTLDVESFTPVINPPQTGILGVNNIVTRAREADGKVEFYPAMGLSLTFDHRALDGAPAARFLKELKTNLENFSVLLAKG